MIDYLKEIKILAKNHPIPSEIKLERRMKRIERMTAFYQEKAPEAPEKQSQMFTGFVSALLYAGTMIRMYRKLTKRLAVLAEEGGDNGEAIDD